jgi:hypothetical protein
MSYFAQILAVCQAQVITIPTIRMGVIECKLSMRIDGIVITRAQHTAKIRAKKRYSTAYLALKGCNKLKTVRNSLCADRASVRPSDIFSKRQWVSLGTSHGFQNSGSGSYFVVVI